MILLRPSAERGHTKIDWLDSRHTFSFGDYYDPRHRGFMDLVVINEDRIAPGGGFGRHGHRDMEIITYVLEGALRHEDSLGTGSVIRPGEVQRMSAGNGILHSEFNESDKESVHLLQIWIMSDQQGIPPEYEQKEFSIASHPNRLHLVVSADGRNGSLKMHQHASVYASVLQKDAEMSYEFEAGRRGWIQIARGSVQVNGIPLSAGDGGAIVDEPSLKIKGVENSEILLFDLP